MPIRELSDGTRLMSGPEVEKHFKRTGLVHFIGMLSPPRPGVLDCFQKLEFTYYPPDTKKNEDFYLTLLEWEEITWGIVSIPEGERSHMDISAIACGLRVADGTPMIFAGGVAPASFPIRGENVFTLETASKHPSPTGRVQEV